MGITPRPPGSVWSEARLLIAAAGACVICYGLWSAYPPLGWVFAGTAISSVAFVAFLLDRGG